MLALVLKEKFLPKYFIMYHWLYKTQSLKNISRSFKGRHLNQVDPIEKWDEDSGTENSTQQP